MPQTRKPKSLRWPIIVITLLVIHVGLMLTAVAIATADRSFAVTPNYYQKAVHWDQTKALQQASDKLGWKAQVLVGSDLDALNQREISIELKDADGHEVTADKGELRLFHYSRGNDIQTIALKARDGKLVGSASLGHPGFYEFQLTATRGSQTFVEIATRHVEAVRRSGS